MGEPGSRLCYRCYTMTVWKIEIFSNNITMLMEHKIYCQFFLFYMQSIFAVFVETSVSIR